MGCCGDHGGQGETSLLWTIRPELVRLDGIEASQPLDGVLGEDPRERDSEGLGREAAGVIGQHLGDAAERLLDGSALQRAQYMEALAAGVSCLSVCWPSAPPGPSGNFRRSSRRHTCTTWKRLGGAINRTPKDTPS